MKHLALTFVLALGAAALGQAQTTLGAFTFNNAQFGNTIVESDGGTYSSQNWLNTANVDPGNPAYLTGANFETGIANLDGVVTYTIGYNTAIVNNVGADLGVVVARYDSNPFDLEVSTDGVTFSAVQAFAPGTAVATGVSKDYYYGGFGPYPADLSVHAIDLDSFGIAAGGSIVSARIRGEFGFDLVRVAGLNAVPEPGTLCAFGVAGLLAARRRRAKASA